MPFKIMLNEVKVFEFASGLARTTQFGSCILLGAMMDAEGIRFLIHMFLSDSDNNMGTLPAYHVVMVAFEVRAVRGICCTYFITIPAVES